MMRAGLGRVLTLGAAAARRAPSAARLSMASGGASKVTGMPAGPFQVGVTTIQFDDASRKDPTSGGPRRLQTEIWYPAAASAAELPRNKYSDFLGGDSAPEGAVAAADAADAIGGYKDGLTIASLDSTWPNEAVRDAAPCGECARPWPLVIFSHGSGAFRASYIYWTEFLASHGFVVAACDHLGSARYTIVDGEVVKPGGARSTRAQMEADRPADMRHLIDRMEALSAAGGDARFAGRIDASRTALTGMSFGGWASAAALEAADARVKCAVMQCASIAMSGGGKLATEREERTKPVLLMLGSEDTVVGEAGNEACRQYAASHEGPAYLLEIRRGGHVSFTSCELYNEEYGNGIGPSASLSAPGATYEPLPIAEQHRVINSYGLAFLNAHLRPDYEGAAGAAASDAEFNAAYLRGAHFDEDEVTFRSNGK